MCERLFKNIKRLFSKISTVLINLSFMWGKVEKPLYSCLESMPTPILAALPINTNSWGIVVILIFSGCDLHGIEATLGTARALVSLSHLSHLSSFVSTEDWEKIEISVFSCGLLLSSGQSVTYYLIRFFFFAFWPLFTPIRRFSF